MAEVEALHQRLAVALEAGARDDVERLLAELSVVEKRRNRLLQRASPADGGYDAAPPVREQVAAVLNVLSRPASVALIRDVAQARFADIIQPSRLASLRRDEQRSWTAAHRGGGVAGARSLARPVYIVPALTFDRFAPVRGMLALSSWTLETRLIAPASPRVDILHIIIRLVEELNASPDAPWAPDLRRLVWRFARTIAGAIQIRDGFDYAQVRDAAERELRQIADPDAAERAESAQRARKQLDDELQLFGAPLRLATRTSTEATG